MTTKTYRSPSNIAINVVLSNGSNFLVSFNSKTIGGSVFTTSNEDVQNAIERHYNYNKLFFLERTVTTEDKTSKTSKKATVADKSPEPDPVNGDEPDPINGDEPKDDNPENGKEAATEEEELTDEEDVVETDTTEEGPESDAVADGMTEVEVTDLVSARDYLNDNFGIKKSTIMSKASIMEAAQAHNIVFIGLS